MDDLEVPLFEETSIWIQSQILDSWCQLHRALPHFTLDIWFSRRVSGKGSESETKQNLLSYIGYPLPVLSLKPGICQIPPYFLPLKNAKPIKFIFSISPAKNMTTNLQWNFFSKPQLLAPPLFPPIFFSRWSSQHRPGDWLGVPPWKKGSGCDEVGKK